MVKRHRNSTPKQAAEEHNRTTTLEWSVMFYWRGGLN